MRRQQTVLLGVFAAAMILAGPSACVSTPTPSSGNESASGPTASQAPAGTGSEPGKDVSNRSSAGASGM